jgi:DNA-binding transcriptional regulator YiaG
MNPQVLIRIFPGLSHSEIAERLGVATSTVSCWFHRRRIPASGQLVLVTKFSKQLRAVT